jgi:hypothetical protein
VDCQQFNAASMAGQVPTRCRELMRCSDGTRDTPRLPAGSPSQLALCGSVAEPARGAPSPMNEWWSRMLTMSADHQCWVMEHVRTAACMCAGDVSTAAHLGAGAASGPGAAACC